MTDGDAGGPPPESVLDQVPALIWKSGPDFGGTYFNKTWLDFRGRRLEEEVDGGWLSGVHPDDRRSIEAYADALDRRAPFQAEYRLQRHDGEWRWMLDTGRPCFDEDGNFESYVGCCIDITDRKEAETRLALGEERLSLAQEAAAVGSYDWDVERDSINWSAEMFELHGIDPATKGDRIYEAWLEHLHPDDRERADRQTREFTEVSDRLSIEFRIIHPERGVRWIMGRGRVIRDRDGRPLRMIGVNLDITEKRIAEEAMRESEQRLRDIAENFPGVIFRRVTYPDGRIEYPFFSGSVAEIFGLDKEAFERIETISDVTKLIHYEDIESMLARYRRASETLTPLDIEGRVLTVDGAVRWVRSVSHPRKRNDGVVVWDGVILDVTEEHLREAESERATTMLRMGMELAGIGTWEYDPDDGSVQASALVHELFGLEPDGDRKHRTRFLDAVHPDDAEWVTRGLLDAAQQRSPLAREYRILRPDGTTCWIASRASFVELADGTRRMIGALFDVTPRKLLEEEREKALERQTTLLRELDHRVKNNLQMIVSMLRIQASRAGTGEASRQLQAAIDRVQALSDLHSRLQVEDGLHSIDFGAHLEAFAESVRGSMLGGKPIELRCLAPVCTMDVDKAVPLGLVVNELVTNAIKYAFPENRAGLIEIVLRPEASAIFLEIRDDGIGIGEKTAGGMGMRLVESLILKVEGKMERRGPPGVHYRIELPASWSLTQSESQCDWS